MQKTNLFNTIYKYVIIAIAILLVGISSIILLNTTTFSVNADSNIIQDNSKLSVNIVKRNTTNNSINTDAGKKSISNNDYVFLDTMPSDSYQEVIYIEFGQVAYIQSISISLNSTTYIKPNDITQSDGLLSFDQFLCLIPYTTEDDNDTWYTKDTNNNNITSSLDGSYEITIRYRNYSDGNTSTLREAKINFKAITKGTYTNINEQPSMNNVEYKGTDGNTYFQTFEYHYDNSNLQKLNTSTIVDYLNNVCNIEPSTAKLYYPTLTFNPEKYLLTITRTLYRNIETTTMSFTERYNTSSTIEGVLTLTTTANNKTTTREIILQRVGDPGIYTATLEFTQVGEYEFAKQFLLRTNAKNTIGTYETIPVSNMTNDDIKKPEKLTIFGFQTNYATSTSTKAIMYNDQYSSNVYDANKIFSTNFNFANNKPPTTSTKPSDGTAYDTFVKSLSATSNTTLVAYTNQAPVSFDYLGTLNNGWYVRTSNSGQATIKDYTKGQQFSDAGTYFVYLSYQYSTYSYTQIICFIINNSPIKATMYTTSDPLSLNTENDPTIGVGDFTNKNVYLDWAKEGPFDSTITAVYSIKNYDDNSNITYNSANRVIPFSSGNPTVFTNNGKYSIKITKGNDTNTASYYNFTIDKQSISGISALAIDISQDNKVNTTPLSSMSNFHLVVGNNFAWTWDNKNSGAKINYAKYFYAPINTISNNFSTTGFMSNTLLTTNAQFDNFTYISDYSRLEKNSKNTYNTATPSQIISSSQIAVLLLADEAGNTSIFVTILDKTSPSFIQNPAKTTYTNIINQDTLITWGTHKLIKLSNKVKLLFDSGNGTNTDNNLTSGITINNYLITANDYIFTLNNAWFSNTTYNETGNENENLNGTYLKVVINSVKITYGNNNYTQDYTPQATRDDTIEDTIKVDTTNQQTYLNINSSRKVDISGKECTYNIAISDIVGNSKQEIIRVNLDQSQGMMYSYKSVDNALTSIQLKTTDTFDNNSVNRRYVPQDYSTNKKYITFKWQEPGSGFTIASIVLNFYALTYDTSSNNYPYSNTPTTITTIYDGNSNNINSVSINENGDKINGTSGIYQSNALQLVSNQSQAGMYVLIRTYNNDFDNASASVQNGDTKTREYRYYVDRDPIIGNNAGSDISLSWGYDSYNNYDNYTKQNFDDFSKYSNSTTLTANLLGSQLGSVTCVSGNFLPVSINTMINKYGNTNASQTRLQYASRIYVCVQYFTGTTTTAKSTTYYSTDDINGFKSFNTLSNAFTEIGWYRVIFFDMANANAPLIVNDGKIDILSDDSLLPNCYITYFRIQAIRPSATIEKKASTTDTTYVTLKHNNYQVTTNGNCIRVTFEDPENIYQAHIDYKNVKYDLTQSKYNTIYSETTNNLINSISLITSESAINENAITPTLYYMQISNNPNRYKYYIILPASITNSAGTTNDLTYSLKLHYIENSNEFNNYNDYYSTTFTINIDHTAPYEDLYRLIENDTFLNNFGSDFISELKSKIDTTPLLENYAFTVAKNQLSTYLTVGVLAKNSAVYCKQRTDYDGSSGKQTVVPGTSAYDELDNNTRKFIPTTYSGFNKYESNMDLSNGYYDIVEVDYAGNYRVFTIYVTDVKCLIDYTNGINGATGTLQLTNEQHNDVELTGENSIINNTTTIPFWSHISYIYNDSSIVNYYLIPQDAQLNDFDSITLNSNYVFYTQTALINALNNQITEKYNALRNIEGCIIQYTFDGFNSTYNAIIKIRTPGKNLVQTLSDIQLTVNDNKTSFTITIPNANRSTYITGLTVTSNGTKMTTDSSLTQINTYTQGTKYTFRLTGSSEYNFEFTDNFGRKSNLVYPTDSTTQKELVFSRGYVNKEIDGTIYKHTTNDTSFVYQSNILSNIQITITDMTTGTVVYDNNKDKADIDKYKLSPDNDYYTYSKDLLTNSVTTIKFNTPKNAYYLYEISVGATTTNMYNFEYVLYTYFPDIILTNINNVTLWTSSTMDKVTSQPVKITWINLENALHNPKVNLIFNGTSSIIESPKIVAEEGQYTITLSNDIGTFSESITFTIREYDVPVYGVYQVNRDSKTELVSRDKSYGYIVEGKVTLLTEYFFLGNWDSIEIVVNDNKNLSATNIEQKNNTRIYEIKGESTHIIDIYIAITHIPTVTTSTIVDFKVNGTIQRDYSKTLTPTTSADGETIISASAEITWTNKYTDPEYTDVEIEKFYVIDLWYNNTFVNTYDSGKITLTKSGTYTIKLHDLVNQYQRFGTSYDKFTLTIYNDVVFTVNGQASIYNAIYNDPVTLKITNYSSYTQSTFSFNVTKNNINYNSTLSQDGEITFSEPGVYKITMSGKLTDMGKDAQALTNTYLFTILSKTEARACFEFAPITGYTIKQVYKVATNSDGTETSKDITKEINSGAVIHSIYLSTASTWGIGIYKLIIEASGDEFTPTQTYTFSLWINESDPIITPSRDWGTSKIAGFNLTFNPTTIYEKIGDCYIKINDKIVYTINESTISALSSTNPVALKYTEQGEYLVQLYTASGNLVSSNRLTINEPLNTASIIIIVLFVMVVVGVTITLIVMRKHMRVR